MADLGPEVFRLGEDNYTEFRRHDFRLQNMRGMRLECSWFKPLGMAEGTRLPCVVYCHGNSGSRRDALGIRFLLGHGFTVFALDFCGSGMSEGTQVSLGFYERQDLAEVVEYLNSRPDEVDGIALWGRSMGAVSAIMYASKDPSIRCIICDSPFASLHRLINELVKPRGGAVGKTLWEGVANIAVRSIGWRIQSKAYYDINKLDTTKYAAECKVPCFFIHGVDDELINDRHSADLFAIYQDPRKVLQLVSGGHNDERDEAVRQQAVNFLTAYMIDGPCVREELAEFIPAPVSSLQGTVVAQAED